MRKLSVFIFLLYISNKPITVRPPVRPRTSASGKLEAKDVHYIPREWSGVLVVPKQGY